MRGYCCGPCRSETIWEYREEFLCSKKINTSTGAWSENTFEDPQLMKV